jgi:predicted aspartyl protease
MKIHNIIICLLFPLFMIGQTKAEKKEALKKQKILFAVTSPNKNFVEKVTFNNLYDMIIVPVTIEGQIYNFLFDTGAVTIVSSQLQQQLGLKPIQSSKMVDGSGTVQEEEFYTLKSLQFGSTVFNNITTAVIDLTKFEKMFCIKLDGVFGTNIMRKYNWKVDYKNKQITFSDKKIKPEWKAIEIDFKESYSGSPLLIQYMGGKSFYTTMDTGFNGSISIQDSLYFKSTKAGKLKEYKSYGKSALTLFSGQTETVEHLVRIDTMHLGDKMFNNKLADIEAGGMLIGNKFFKEFGEILIDWDKEKLYLQDVLLQEDTERKTFGFTPLKTDEGVFVGTIWEGSDAQKQGMELGDAIIAINGKELNNEQQDIWCELVPLFMGNITPKIEVTISKKDGSVKKAELNEYNILSK